ncbi:MAG: hypothetical protein HDR01_01330 [Lachnospiraceae bacterium]|nr:hypothetical protein [Lachnospiraceae bacterium]
MLSKKYRLRYLPLFYVDNYIIYYVVIDDNPNDLIMEVRRFFYNGQNRENMV